MRNGNGDRELEISNLSSTAELSEGACSPLLVVIKNPELTRGWRDDAPPEPAASLAHLAGLGFFIMIILALVAFIVFGGTFDG